MSAAFEQAWLLLKAAFQPIEGKFIGSGMNQSVYGQEGNPDVVKVGRLDANPGALSDPYWSTILSEMTPDIVSQRPIQQTAELPSEVNAARLPFLSIQERGEPFEDYERQEDALRGRELAQMMYDRGDIGPLLEYMRMADAKPPNWMKVKRRSHTYIPESQIRPEEMGRDQAVLMDPMYYLPDDESHTAHIAAGPPRRRGKDYEIPEESIESLARQVDKEPFEQFIEPVESSYEEFLPEREEHSWDHMAQGQQNVDRMLELLGLR